MLLLVFPKIQTLTPTPAATIRQTIGFARGTGQLSFPESVSLFLLWRQPDCPDQVKNEEGEGIHGFALLLYPANYSGMG